MSRSVMVGWLAALVAALIGTPEALGIDGPPPAPREFRAAWVATVGNIDWPSRPGLSTEEQQREAVAILDRAAALKLNAVIFQVRTSADALYESDLEPWSAFLTGEQGKAPVPYYDPLRFWVDGAHRRGLQLHAWFNPFRARYQSARYEESPGHVSRARPDLVKAYGNLLWLDPGEADAREQTFRVFMDVARRYDVDGLHIDDYFYPYPVAGPVEGQELPFPDDPSWQAYQASGGGLARDDWRRRNINELIERVYKGLKAEKPQVQFGISPFGIPRPGQPPVVRGFDQYEKLYADTVLWLNRGWCDYWTPQLYWPIDAPQQPFRALLEYWVEQDTQHRHVWPGLFTSRVGQGGTRNWEPREIVDQIEVIRETPGASGAVHFSMKALLRDQCGLADRLEQGPYAKPALVPPSPWLDDQPPAPPEFDWLHDAGETSLSLRPGVGGTPFLYAVRFRNKEGAWSLSLHPAEMPIVPALGDIDPNAEVVVTAVDRLGNESEAVRIPTSRGD